MYQFNIFKYLSRFYSRPGAAPDERTGSGAIATGTGQPRSEQAKPTDELNRRYRTVTNRSRAMVRSR